ncbi:HNH endonuclease [Cellulomonas sp. ACRRI]|uniref:HNH endonuclease signature motif containing protein n=1 Tax=Cellulomonas sp. ACRRI TaxID=2918188 RepID=UPI001EF24145|nr:HNH endonuclease signature motif containing protein [Cellulomonas sp. ACRRI]MCG7285380.1 HNH endonuclease [Cellulomonas sp. ACRRI]
MAAFWANVDRTPTCWLWTGYITNYGYGAFAPKRGVTKRAHRVAWEATNGPIPDGLVLDHVCRVRHCVRPDHLEPVTDGENTRRGIGPSALNSRKTKCSKGHPFTPENTRVVGDGRRSCWTCTRSKWAAILARQRAERDAQQCTGTAKRSGARCQLKTASPDGLCPNHANAKVA